MTGFKEVVGNIYGIGALILVISYMVMILRSFHNKYFVIYESISWGIKVELLVSSIISIIMATFTFIFWPIPFAIIGLVVFLNIRKADNLFTRLIWIIPMSILAAFIMVMGICSWILA